MTGALIGGAIAGGVGAIIGSQTNKKGKTMIKTIVLSIVVEDIKNPIINMPVLNSVDGYKSDGQMIAMARTIAQRWDAIFKIILKQNSKLD